MGSSIARVIRPRQTSKVWILGIDGGGKTILLYKLKTGEIVNTIPTINFNIETVSYMDRDFDMWDTGGTTKFRPEWGNYFANMDAVIVVVDSADVKRFGDAADELRYLLTMKEVHDALRGVPLLLFANKQDVLGAKAPVDVLDALKVEDLLRGRRWHVVGSSFVNGSGIDEGLSWLTRTLDST